MSSKIEMLKRYAIIRKQLARQFGYTEKIVQDVMDQIYAAVSANNFILTAELLISLATPEDNYMHIIFDWTKDSTYRKTQAEAIIQQVPFFITSDGILFSVIEK